MNCKKKQPKQWYSDIYYTSHANSVVAQLVCIIEIFKTFRVQILFPHCNYRIIKKWEIKWTKHNTKNIEIRF